jgi:predicted RNA methylase
MKSGENTTKELYKQLRALPWRKLWEEEVARFNEASPKERLERVAVIRAVGVVFPESGPPAQQHEVKQWLVSLLQDPGEKIRRYAMTALPKIGSGVGEEKVLLTLLKSNPVEREKKFLARTLDKIGGEATLKTVAGLLPQTELKVKASVARSQSPSIVRMDGLLSKFSGLKIHLRGRSGLEEIVRDEVAELITKKKQFRIDSVSPGLVVLTPLMPFTLGDLYALRCFGSANFVLGMVPPSGGAEPIEALAKAITSPLAREVFQSFTKGSIRYRLNFVDQGARRGAVRLIANRAFALCPDILNDARQSPWAIDIHPVQEGDSVELRPRFAPDPRLYYRQMDVPAASHPPLAACMARLARPSANEVVWDPFCGSGLELIETALRGGVKSVFGTDLSSDAIDITRNNFAAAKLNAVQASFIRCDFRDFRVRVRGLDPGTVSLVVTNPPLGKRVPIPDLEGLIDDLFAVAATVLKPGGRLVFANPFQMESPERSLQLQSRRKVDFGGFDCWLEVYRKK